MLLTTLRLISSLLLRGCVRFPFRWGVGGAPSVLMGATEGRMEMCAQCLIPGA
jgi:hypothetical protein